MNCPPNSHLPTDLILNARVRGKVPASGPLADDAETWILAPMRQVVRDTLWMPPEPDRSRWYCEDVGWGLVLPMIPETEGEDLWKPIGAPKSIWKLWEARRSWPIYRVAEYAPDHPVYLRRFATDDPKGSE